MHIEKDYNCLICNSDQAYERFHVKEMMFGKKLSFPYIACAACGTIQQIDPPDDLSAFYPKDYYAHLSLVHSSWIIRLLKKLRYKIYMKFNVVPLAPIFGPWFRVIQPTPRARIADIGCGNGQLLYELYATGFKHLDGYDPYIEEETAVNGGLHIYKRSIFEIEKKYDVVMMHHALEHTGNPAEVIQQAFAILNPGGTLLVRIPIADAEAWRIYGVHWVQLDAPRHLCIPSVAGLKALAEKCGFEFFNIQYDSSAFQFWGSEMYQRGIKLNSMNIHTHFSAQEMDGYEKNAHLLNQEGKGDQACFYFRKP